MEEQVDSNANSYLIRFIVSGLILTLHDFYAHFQLGQLPLVPFYLETEPLTFLTKTTPFLSNFDPFTIFVISGSGITPSGFFVE